VVLSRASFCFLDAFLFVLLSIKLVHQLLLSLHSLNFDFAMSAFLWLKGLAGSLLLSGLASAIPVEENIQPRTSSCNTADNRACWSDGFSIETDYESSIPDGIDRHYDWEVTEVENWVGPDGVTKGYVQLVNGQYPGPTLFAEWGDTISVTVTNSLPVNG
jgi:FtsP/CotA-like multicopper oxidase with cupredoxin domain